MFFIVSIPFYGQNQKAIDSLLGLSSTAIPDREMVDLYVALSLEYVWMDSLNTGKYVEKAVELGEEISYEEGVIEALCVLRIDFISRGFYNKSDSLAYAIIERSKKAKYLKGEVHSYNGLAYSSRFQGDYDQSLALASKAMELGKEADLKQSVAVSYELMGSSNYYLENYDAALKYYAESLQLFMDLEHTGWIAYLLNDKRDARLKLGQYPQAEEQFSEALAYAEPAELKPMMGWSYKGLGMTFFEGGDLIKSENYFRKAYPLFEEIGDKYNMADVLIANAKLFLAKGDLGVAEETVKEAITVGIEISAIEKIRNAYELLSNIQLERGDYEEALKAHVLFKEMSDSLIDQETTNYFARYEFQQEKDSLQFANEKAQLILDQQIEKQRNLQVLGIAGLILLILIIAVLFRYYQLKNESNQKLVKLNESLKDLNQEKNSFIGIVAHDLKNPLANIISSVDAMPYLKTEEERNQVMHYLRESSTRLTNMISTILNVEAIEERMENLELEPVNLSKMARELVDHYRNQANQKSIQLMAKLEEEVFVLANHAYLPQVIENLLSNAIKFSPEEKNIHINLTVRSGRAQLEVQDEGPVLTTADKEVLFQKYQILSAQPTGGEDSTGLGLSIVKKYMDAMKGRVWCDSEEGRGASFFISFEVVNGKVNGTQNVLVTEEA